MLYYNYLFSYLGKMYYLRSFHIFASSALKYLVINLFTLTMTSSSRILVEESLRLAILASTLSEYFNINSRSYFENMLGDSASYSSS